MFTAMEKLYKLNNINTTAIKKFYGGFYFSYLDENLFIDIYIICVLIIFLKKIFHGQKYCTFLSTKLLLE